MTGTTRVITSGVESAETPKLRAAFWAVCICSFLLQLYVASMPSVGDSQIYMQWFRALAKDGLAGAYWDKPVAAVDQGEAYYRIDYPPVYPYILYTQARAMAAVLPASVDQDSRVLFFIKIPSILAGILISFLLFREVERIFGQRAAFIVGSLFAFSPPVLFNTAFWGQSDSIFILFVMLSLICFRRSPELAWLFLTVSCFTKPLGYIYVPLMIVATLKYFQWKRLILSLLICGLTACFLLIPFVVVHRLSSILYSLVFQIDAAPYISANADNFWWLVGGGLPWISANQKIFGPLTYESIALLFLAAFYAVTLWKYAASKDEKALYFAAASIAFGFFSISTHMHENHLVPFLPLLSLIWWQNRTLTYFFAVISLTTFANLLLYDLMFIYLTIPGLFLTLANSFVNVLLFLYWIFAFYSFRSFDPVVEGEARLLPGAKKMALLMIGISLLASAVFFKKTQHFSTEHFLLNSMKAATIRANPNSTAVSLWNINNDLRPAIYEHPPAEISYDLSLPKEAILKVGIALNPAVWATDKGDGVLFEIFVSVNDVRRKIFSRYIDPKKNIDDRKWHDETVDLSQFKGEKIRLILATSGGPIEDTTYDSAAWGDPRIIMK